MDVTTLTGLAAGALTTVSFLPQAIQTWKTKQTKDISLPMYARFKLGVFTWLLSGILANSLPVIVANAVTFVFASCILVLKIRHG